MAAISRRLGKLACIVVLALAIVDLASAHEGPDPVAHWYFSPSTVRDGAVRARLGPDAKLIGGPRLVDDRLGTAMRFDGVQDWLLVSATGEEAAALTPAKCLTLSAWAAVERGQPHGALVSSLEHDAEGQRGWLLGYNDRVFRFALSTIGADDGNGRLTIVEGVTRFEPGKYYHIVGTYDGVEMRLYVNGRLEASSREQSGPIYQSRYGACAIGASIDRDETHPHQGLIRDIAIYDLAATEKWVAHEFDHGNELVALEAAETLEELRFVVTPYLQNVTQTGITVMWEATRPSQGKVLYGLTGDLELAAESKGESQLHEVTLEGLQSETPYSYRIECTDDRGRSITSPLLTFQTAVRRETPFAFGVLGDTQENPRVCKLVSDMLWMQRPNFLIIAGDLVDSGPNKRQWTEQFFPGMMPLASRVAFFPVLGNHEQNARHYYHYMSLPAPEYFYSFQHGNAQFFMLDSNKNVGTDSEQFKWLETQLAESTATWKFVAYHHPAYSSDEDDYGDMWKGERSSYGELRLRPLVKLFDRYGVDIVWNGHIHSYERTWPLNNERVVERGGTIYMITGGAGGGLETAGPIRPWFQNNVKHGHHYCLVCVNGRKLEFKAFDMEGRLFDYMAIDKAISGGVDVLPSEVTAR